MLEVRLIGKFDIQCNGKPVIISSRAAQSLFAYLILTAGTSHRREKLAGMLWPDAPEEKARAYLRHELWRIRKALSSRSKADYLLVDDLSICFNPSVEYWLDVTVLRNAGDASSSDELISALHVYEGELLPGFYEDWVTLEREHVQTLYEQKMGLLLELLEKERRWKEMLEWAERWISLGEAPEAAFRYLMMAYDALGNHAQVTATYERCVQALHELDLEPSEQTRTLAFKRTPKLNIPIPLTSFIGREKELKEVAELLSNSRLVTLTGSGGVGKTRLSIQVVADVLTRFPDGVWFLDLAPLSDPALVPTTLANLLGLRESGELPVIDLLRNFFQSRTVLVIFDNCEHLIEACARLAHSLLTSCPSLSILATSRELLRVSGEIPYRVPSLETPNLDVKPAVDTSAKIESVQLFVERAVVASPRFAVSPQNAFAIAQICRRLDGIPLAIELAAARTNILTAEQISERLDDRFRLLKSGLRSALPRHQTLRAMIEWSYDLLSEKEKLLFRRLAVFSGGWTLEAAENVCSTEGIERSEILDLLTQLVNKSLIVVETWGGESRYRRLETIRQFAREKLIEATEAGLLHDRHLAYFLTKVEEIAPHLMGAEQSAWMDYLELELDNIRAAMECSISKKKGEESLRLFGSLAWFLFIHCHFQEGLEWFRRTLELRNGTSKQAQAKALADGSWLNYAMGDLATASARRQESADLYRELGDLKGLSTQLQFLGVMEAERGNRAQARPFLEESLRISRAINNRLAIPRVLLHLGLFSESEGDHVIAWHYFEESLTICRELGEGHLTMIVLSWRGSFALAQKNTREARQYCRESLEIGIKLKNKRTIAEEFLSFAEILCTEERYSESAQLQGFAETLFKDSDSLTESHLADIKRTADIPEKRLGEESYRKEFDIGKKLTLEQAVEIALEQSP
jgi:predicted ATPase/DNA-binding SARP family transcriptional activator